jgi:hypothetical protein
VEVGWLPGVVQESSSNDMPLGERTKSIVNTGRMAACRLQALLPEGNMYRYLILASGEWIRSRAVSLPPVNFPFAVILQARVSQA